MTEDTKSGCFEERPEGIESGLTYIYNPNKSLSISSQRTRLPIFQSRDQILYLLEKYQTLVIQGETGSGKSTQLPQYLYETGWTTGPDGNKLMIGVTQPRRVAAVSLAVRVADEMKCDLGSKVGYSIRFDEKWSPESTRIKFMTEGILLRELMSDPLLDKYSVVMVDEVHERSLNTDILLGLLKKILKRRPLLRLIVSSATLDVEDIRRYFELNKSDQSKNTAAILSVEGQKNFPVDIHYLKSPVANYVQATIDVIIKIHENEPGGDVLAFLTGADEVSQVVSSLIDYSRSLKDQSSSSKVRKMFVLPLHGSLKSGDQYRVFEQYPSSTRKVIVATNIAETSVTIPGIVYVVDCGFVKMRFYDPKTSFDTLTIVPISRSSAEQRAGRVGRTKHGVVYRLYQKSEFDKLKQFTIPEIQRSSMAMSILQLGALGVSNVVKFDFLSKPPTHNIISGLQLLFALEAIDDNGQLTSPLGLQMAEFPLEPMAAKMLLTSGTFKCSEEILTIVSMLQVENIFIEPSSGQRALQARNCRHKFSVHEGDLITYLNIYNSFIFNDRRRNFADQNYLNYKSLLRVGEIRSRLRSLLERFKVKIQSSEGDLEPVLKCITSGFFSNAAYLSNDGQTYKTIRGDHCLHVHPNSVLNWCRRPPKHVLFHTILTTSQEFMRDITAIDSQWLHQLAPHYYSYGTQRERSSGLN